MKKLIKDTNKDFVILNLSDPQLSNGEWAEGHKARAILEYTIKELMERVKPDLVTVSGDIAWAGDDYGYDMFAATMESYGVPWAPVWGNHDNQKGPEVVGAVADRYMACPHCLYEKGDPVLGNGNYVILIEENERPVEALVMVDSNDRDPYPDGKGGTKLVWAKLTDVQAKWYPELMKELKAMGVSDVTAIMHIPIYAYHYAADAAYKAGLDRLAITPEEADGDSCWNEGYPDSFGVQYENIESYPEDEGMLDVIRAEGLTKHIVSGHDHKNNFVIHHEGLTYVYGLKAGCGCYWNPILNGGTVLTVGSEGVKKVHHEYVDVSEFLK